MIVGRKKVWLGAAASPVAAACLAAGVLLPDRISPVEARSRASNIEARGAAGTTAHGRAVDCGELRCGTVPAVPGIITELKKRGYTFVTVPRLLAPGVAEPGAVYKP